MRAGGSQRGALFGIDARLALMIFGALSIVAGFIGYSRVDTAKDARVIREIQAFDEALLGLQADVQAFILFALEQPNPPEDIAMLWDKSLLKQRVQPFWHGPYLTTQSSKHQMFGRWGLVFGDQDRATCQLVGECYAWIQLTDVPADVWERINRVIDEAYGQAPENPATRIETGIVQANQPTDPRILYYRSVSRPHV